MPPPPVVLTIAGSDSSCGAGVQADLKAISALGGYALNALTSVVSETPGIVSQVRLLDAEFVADQIRVLFEGFPIAAAKTGMLGGKDQVQAVVAAWKQFGHGRIPLVVDPVMIATSGGRLLEDAAMQTLIDEFLPLATLITPNMDEARVLWDREVTTLDDMEACARDLSARFDAAVLVKGGHLQGDAADVLCFADEIEWHTAPRTPGVHTHGTGCTFSAAIATALANEMGLNEAVAQAKQFVSRAIADHFVWQSAGAGLVHALNHLQQTCA
ncbi:bifunctional hydroxymethylpyrimidine kinase/phosphomethylpyrimidine kinase [Prosthecobacter sp.]|uniref:bifunctional hydroxymethylpyrimidine kinase/phosphomethylpyrimidine kinase n=1 Tax=Prosthecobacter sp. TaxID=1965333 RepID=UPI001D487C97|nr:bifunctional hydroxymethylpyrimidine kinase/phosphomethylpyrimidine kinase [Prosthecobacter sp.]MCB1278267.1 bifunctional hydroxymethylpyrimidine kinase/phosphomethylpyrimidine kinase [Prosthecobacter sp.]